MDIVFASANPGKIRELTDLLQPRGYRVREQGDFDIESVEETGLSFVENALIKARHACHHTGLAALADDSGLEVDILGGAPGLYSSRLAERHGTGSGDAANVECLLEQLADVPTDRRQARFRCVLVMLRHAQDPAPLIAEGVWPGHILTTAEGSGGFGYDPVFASDDTGVAAALLSKADKNRLSHRAQALSVLLERLPAASGPTTRR